MHYIYSEVISDGGEAAEPSRRACRPVVVGAGLALIGGRGPCGRLGASAASGM
jgi:hypothetical protein